MAGHEEQEIAIVGAGVAGLGTALALHRIGVKSLVLEQAGNLRTAGAAFVMWPNAWTALESLGVANLIRPYFYQLDRIQGISISRSFKSREIPLVDAGREARCIERRFLLETLKKALPADTVRYGCKLKALESHPESGRTILKFADGSKVSAKLMIGCDGIYSAVGRWLGLPPAKSTGRCAYRGMARLPQEKQGKKKLMLQMMHKGVRAGKLHCRDNLLVSHHQPPSIRRPCGSFQRRRENEEISTGEGRGISSGGFGDDKGESEGDSECHGAQNENCLALELGFDLQRKGGEEEVRCGCGGRVSSSYAGPGSGGMPGVGGCSRIGEMCGTGVSEAGEESGR